MDLLTTHSSYQASITLSYRVININNTHVVKIERTTSFSSKLNAHFESPGTVLICGLSGLFLFCIRDVRKMTVKFDDRFRLKQNRSMIEHLYPN